MYGEKASMEASVVDHNVVKDRILVVDDDSTCLAVVAAMLKLFGYEVTTAQDPFEALSTLHMNQQTFDLVLTDVHMPSMNGIELLKHVQQEFKIPVILMSGDDQRSTALQGLEQGAAYFILKPPTLIDLKNLWQYVISNKKGKSDVSVSLERSISCNGSLPIRNPKGDDMHHISSSINEEKLCLSHCKRKVLRESSEDVEEKNESNDVPKYTKKAKKLVWTTSLHNKFLQAIGIIGLDRAVPKKILEYMNVPGLTRENIASHLQKYRIYLRRVIEAKDTMKHGIPENWNARPFRSAFSWSEFPSLANNSFLLNYSNARELMQQQHQLPAMPLAQANNYNLGDHNNNMTLLNPAFVGSSQGLNSLLMNTQPNINTNLVQPMNNIGPNVANYESAYLAGQMNILESSMLDAQNNFNTTTTNNSSIINNQVHGLGANHGNNLGTPAVQFYPTKPSTSNVEPAGGSLMNMRASHDHHQQQTTQMRLGGGQPISGYQGGGGFFALDNNKSEIKTKGAIWDDLPLWDIPLPAKNHGVSCFNDNGVARDNHFNACIQQGINQLQLQGNIVSNDPTFAATSYEPIAENQVVAEQEAVEMSNLDNNNNNNMPATQQVPSVENNVDIKSSEPNQERQNFDMLCGSPSNFQDWAAQNLDDFSVDGIDNLADFLFKQ